MVLKYLFIKLLLVYKFKQLTNKTGFILYDAKISSLIKLQQLQDQSR
jgi:hypothetical protein